MSLSANFPTIRPSLLLDFANTKALDPRVTFTRASSAAYYDGKTVAKAEQNLFTYSQPNNNGWVKSGTATLTENSATAPDGTSTASLLTSSATADYIYQSPSDTVTGQTYTFSVYVKNSTSTVSSLYGRFSVTSYKVDLNWSGSTLSSTTTQAGSPTVTTVALSNDWYRVSITYVAAENAVRHRIYSGDAVSTTGDIYVWGAQLEQRDSVTAYTATTTQPITNYVPALQTAASGVARFDHNPTTGESLGLLIEEQRTNLFTYSAAFDDAGWTKTRASITANTVVAPDGTLTGDNLVEDATSSNSHLMSASVSVTSGISYTLSIYAKAAERSWFLMLFPAAQFGANLSAYFDLANGATGTVSVGLSASITPVGNGWYRCSVSASAASSGTSSLTVVRLATGDLQPTYTGDGYSGIYIWGAQLEAGAFPTSYIPTTSAQVTRSADLASMTGTNFSSWYRADEGTVYTDAASVDVSNVRTVFGIKDSGTSEYIFSRCQAGGVSAIRINQANTLQASFTFNNAYANNTFVKTAAAYKTNDSSAATDAVSATTDTVCTIPLVDRIEIGAFAGTNILNGTIKKLAYYPARLTNAELQGLTS